MMFQNVPYQFEQHRGFVAEKQQVITSERYAMHLQLYFYAHKLFLTRLENHESTAISIKIVHSRENEFLTAPVNERFTCYFACFFFSTTK